MGLWGIIVPESGVNLILNPSAETTGNFAAFNGATVTRDTAQARGGDYAYKIVPGGTNRGLSLTTSAAANGSCYVSFYVYGTIAGTLQVTMDGGANYNAAAVVGGSNGGWVRYGVLIPQAQANASVTTTIRDTANETFYVDWAQGEQPNANAYMTSYIDGDQPGIYRWTGLRHGSTSTRDNQERLGGREQDLQTTYGIRVRQYPGAGMPPLANNQQPLALQPGSLFQSARFLPRTLTLTSDIHQTTLAGLHSRRKALITLINPQGKRGAQPVVLSYSGSLSTKKVYGQFRYNGGLELGQYTGGANFIEQTGLVNISLLAVDPFWYEDNRETAVLGFTAGAAKIINGAKRVNGAWGLFGSGFNGVVRCWAYDKNTGRIYVGGDFTTANGVTVNRVCYWNGTTFVAMDSGVSAGVYCMSVFPNGDLIVGGAFLTVGSGAAATKGLARWNLAAGTWTAINQTTTAFTAVLAVATDTSGNFVFGGNFTNYAGAGSNADYFVSYSYADTTFVTPGTPYVGGANGIVNALAFAPNGYLYIGGAFTTVNSVTLNGFGHCTSPTISGGVWLPDGALAGTKTVNAMTIDASGNVYIVGLFTNKAQKWNGTSLATIGAGLTGGTPASISISGSGVIAIGGDSLTVAGIAANHLLAWNGYTYFQYDILDPSLTDDILGLLFVGDDLYIGVNSNTDNWNYAALTTFTPSSSAITFPSFTLIGGSSAGTSALLEWLENQSTAEKQYYNLTLKAGETITIDARPDQTPIVSTWRGAVANQPLMNSDDIRLLPDSNTIAAFISGTTTGVSLLMHWTPSHISVDGAAA